MDPELFLDKTQYQPFHYTDGFAEKRVARYAELGRVFLAVMLETEPIGEVVLKEIDWDKRCCTLGISLVSDGFKNKGYGTETERQALDYVFRIMDFDAVYADSLVTNLRSRHVLEKVGFREIRRDDIFVYYRCDRQTGARSDIVD